jgi:hypothetical protein
MADTQTTPQTEQQRETSIHSHDHVEVFDAPPSSATSHQTLSGSDQHTGNGRSYQGAVGFGNADLRDAQVITGDAEAADFRPTDLRSSELNATDIDTNRTALGANSQDTNWGTILMVIAIILVIILLGTWLF